MKLGLISYKSPTGLGYQTRSYYNFLKPSKTMVIDISHLNGMPLNDDWYPDAWRTVSGFPTNQDYEEFLDGLGCVLLAETPLNYHLFTAANRRGVATILVYNYEFLDLIDRSHLPPPTIFAGPTLWNKNKLADAGIQMELLPVLIDQNDLPKRVINQARHFFHIVGRPAVNDRQGTMDFIRAVKMLSLPNDVRYTIYCQKPMLEMRQAIVGTSIELVEHVPDYADMYREGDVMVLPRRYGGLSLPLNEAIGSGIPVLMPDIDPNNTWLPKEWLIPVMPGRQQFMAHTMVDYYNINVECLAQRMSELYNTESTVRLMHEQAKELAKGLSWEALQPRYEEVIEMAVKMVRR